MDWTSEVSAINQMKQTKEFNNGTRLFRSFFAALTSCV
jgi:hypothetical protein